MNDAPVTAAVDAYRPTGHRLARNTLWNIFGQFAPLLMAALVVPVLIRTFGVAGYGLLTIAWAFVGYFSIFDFGLGRSVTKLVAQDVGSGQMERLGPIVWTAIMMMLAIGVASAVVLAIITPYLVTSILQIPYSLQHDAAVMFVILSGALPLVTMTAGFRGVLEAVQRFGPISVVRVLSGIFTFGSPFLVLPFSRSLVNVVAVLCLGRLLSLIAHVWLCTRILPQLRSIAVRRDLIRPLLSFGGWITIPNIVSPLMQYLDRFFLAALTSVSAVAYYATPYDLLSRIQQLPLAIVGVLFPAFSATPDPIKVAAFFDRSQKYLLLILFPLCLGSAALAPEVLDFWLGHGFSLRSAPVLQVLAIATLINSMAFVPFAMLQARNRPDLAAKLHLIELPLFALMLWTFIHHWGIIGAAAAWTLRCTVDTGALTLFSWSVMGRKVSRLLRAGLLVLVVCLPLLAMSLIPNVAPRLLFAATCLVAWALLAWKRLLEPGELTVLIYRFMPRRLQSS